MGHQDQRARNTFRSGQAKHVQGLQKSPERLMIYILHNQQNMANGKQKHGQLHGLNFRRSFVGGHEIRQGGIVANLVSWVREWESRLEFLGDGVDLRKGDGVPGRGGVLQYQGDGVGVPGGQQHCC